MDWDDLPEAPPAEQPTDLDMLAMTNARLIMQLPLGCRIVMLTSEGIRVSVGMMRQATFDKDEWLTFVALRDQKSAMPAKLGEWVSKKVHSRNAFRVWMDKDVDFGEQKPVDMRDTGTTVGEVCEAWGFKLQSVETEISVEPVVIGKTTVSIAGPGGEGRSDGAAS